MKIQSFCRGPPLLQKFGVFYFWGPVVQQNDVFPLAQWTKIMLCVEGMLASFLRARGLAIGNAQTTKIITITSRGELQYLTVCSLGTHGGTHLCACDVTGYGARAQ